jgi:hypothetical protein
MRFWKPSSCTSKTKNIWKPNNLKVLGSKNRKGLDRIAKLKKIKDYVKTYGDHGVGKISHDPKSNTHV